MAGPPGASVKFNRASAAQESELTLEEEFCAPATAGRRRAQNNTHLPSKKAAFFILEAPK
jgi:hypothetical protein